MSLRKDFPELDNLVKEVTADFTSACQSLRTTRIALLTQCARLDVILAHQLEADRKVYGAMDKILDVPTKYTANIKAIDQAIVAHNAFTQFYNAEGEAGILTRLDCSNLLTIITDLDQRIVAKLRTCSTFKCITSERIKLIVPILMGLSELLKTEVASAIELEKTVLEFKKNIVETGDITEKAVNSLLEYREINSEHAPRTQPKAIKLKTIKPKEVGMKATMAPIDHTVIAKEVYQAIKKTAAPAPQPVATAASPKFFATTPNAPQPPRPYLENVVLPPPMSTLSKARSKK